MVLIGWLLETEIQLSNSWFLDRKLPGENSITNNELRPEQHAVRLNSMCPVMGNYEYRNLTVIFKLKSSIGSTEFFEGAWEHHWEALWDSNTGHKLKSTKGTLWISFLKKLSSNEEVAVGTSNF